MNVVVVDDQENVRYSVAKILGEDEHRVYEFCGCEERLIEEIEKIKPSLLLLDVNLGEISGIDILSILKESDTQINVVLMTAFTTPTNIIEATKLGVRDILQKPFNAESLIEIASKYVKRRGESNHFELEATGESFVGSFETMGEIYKQIGVVATNSLNVMIRGETGCGKELVAKLIHAHSDRKKKSFIAINCAAIPNELFESEFFGHERGSFTGADRQHIGYLESVNGGTIFLDEIGEMPLTMQAKMLRFLESKKIKRVGNSRDIDIDVKIISATNIDMKDSIGGGHFREDLYYRLSSLQVEMPPLRERIGDIPLLVGHFIKMANKDLGCNIKNISQDAMKILCEHEWSGNVRELKNVIINSSLQAVGGKIEKKDIILRSKLKHSGKKGLSAAISDLIEQEGVENSGELLKKIEKELISLTIEKCNGNVARASTYLNISRNTIKAKMRA